eukprot:11221348-Lingulodinium_polyedra.AAC.1
MLKRACGGTTRARGPPNRARQACVCCAARVFSRACKWCRSAFKRIIAQRLENGAQRSPQTRVAALYTFAQ